MQNNLVLCIPKSRNKDSTVMPLPWESAVQILTSENFQIIRSGHFHIKPYIEQTVRDSPSKKCSDKQQNISNGLN